MPALDPFSASSRPMLAFDALPKQPLRFADTLHSIDQNTPRPPKPKRDEHHHKIYPIPAYTHTRTGSSSSDADIRVDHSSQRHPVVGSDEWMSAEVARCVDRADGTLDLKYVSSRRVGVDDDRNRGLSRVSPRIADLRDLVTLPQSYSPNLPASQRHPSTPLPGRHLGGEFSSAQSLPFSTSRSFARINSAPASPGQLRGGVRAPNPRYPSGLGVSDRAPSSSQINQTPEPASPDRVKKPFSRSKTGAVAFGPTSQKAKDICIYLGHNQITR
jgi:hypothetical protein